MKSQEYLSWSNIWDSPNAPQHILQSEPVVPIANRISRCGHILEMMSEGYLEKRDGGLFELQFKAHDHRGSCSLRTYQAPWCGNLYFGVDHVLPAQCHILCSYTWPPFSGRAAAVPFIHLYPWSGQACIEQRPRLYEVNGLQGGWCSQSSWCHLWKQSR